MFDDCGEPNPQAKMALSKKHYAIFRTKNGQQALLPRERFNPSSILASRAHSCGHIFYNTPLDICLIVAFQLHPLGV